MLLGFLIRKANFSRVSTLLKKEGFVFIEEDVLRLLKGNQKGVRYGNMVLVRNEAGIHRKRFIKIILDGKHKTYQLFKRQVKIATALCQDKDLGSPTMAVIRHSLFPPIPYAIFETREEGDGFGFMHDSPAFYEKFTDQDMKKLVEVIYQFHSAGLKVNKDVLRSTRLIPAGVGFYRRELIKLLETGIIHRKANGQEVMRTVEEWLISYTGMDDIRARITETLERCFYQVNSSTASQKTYLVHADMQIDNVYRHMNGDFELLDFEWVGMTHSPAIAIMYDYGNLRARAWSSPLFQKMLDTTMIEVGMKVYSDSAEMIKAGLTLGAVRSSLMMSRYHMDVVNTVKKDKRTEEDYFAMFPKTIESLVQALTIPQR